MNAITQPPIQLSPGQVAAKEKVKHWLETGTNDDETYSKSVFKLQGFAGTGKTTVIRSLLSEFEGTVRFAAFTGKAAMVMRKNSLPAVTIHSLIYKPIEPDKAKCEKLFKQIRETGDARKKDRMQKELDDTRKVKFELKPQEESDLADADLLVLDECSMVNDEMLRDLLSYGIPILSLGDPGQLPPIEGTGALVNGTPDALLTEIHRQAADNPIIDYATRARNLIMIPYGAKGESEHKLKYEVSDDYLLQFDQVLTGKNITRQELNRKMRAMRGFMGVYPVTGEKLICLRNDSMLGVFNGMIAEVVRVGELYDQHIELDLRLETQLNTKFEPVRVKALRAHFESYHDKEVLKNVKWWARRDTQEFDFGYAITVHKSQGSQWDKVLVYDDKFLVWDRKDRARWLYTALTRAAESVALLD